MHTKIHELRPLYLRVYCSSIIRNWNIVTVVPVSCGVVVTFVETSVAVVVGALGLVVVVVVETSVPEIVTTNIGTVAQSITARMMPAPIAFAFVLRAWVPLILSKFVIFKNISKVYIEIIVYGWQKILENITSSYGHIFTSDDHKY